MTDGRPPAYADDRGLVSAWWLAIAATAFLVLLAPLVPDEPFHLSGIMVVAGLACASLAVVAGLRTGVRDAERRRSALGAAAFGLLLIAGWGVSYVMRLMSQLG